MCDSHRLLRFSSKNLACRSIAALLDKDAHKNKHDQPKNGEDGSCDLVPRLRVPKRLGGGLRLYVISFDVFLGFIGDES